MAKRREEIQLMLRSGETLTILASRVKNYGIHPQVMPASKGKFWSITHIPTGLLVTLADSATEAKEIAEILPEFDEPTLENVKMMYAALAQR